MNSLPGHIRQIESEGSVTVLTVMLNGGTDIEVVVINTPETGDYLETGREVDVLFKETELMLTMASATDISVQNRIPCKVSHIETGKMLSRVFLNSEAGSMTALLPSSALKTMKITSGTSLTALVKFNEIMLSSR